MDQVVMEESHVLSILCKIDFSYVLSKCHKNFSKNLLIFYQLINVSTSDLTLF